MIHAKPGARLAAIAGLTDGVEVAIDAPAKEGEANAALLEFLADTLGVKRREVALATGGRSREKLVEVAGGLTVGAAEARLRAAMPDASRPAAAVT